jgi:hypothetical protein
MLTTLVLTNNRISNLAVRCACLSEALHALCGERSCA